VARRAGIPELSERKKLQVFIGAPCIDRPTYSSGVWCGRVSYTLLCVVAIETVTSASFYDVYIKTSRPIGPKLITKKVNNKKS